MHLYLTPAALGYLTQLILAGLIGGYVLLLARKPGRPHHTLWLSAFMICIALFIATLFLEVSVLPTPRLRVVYMQNTVLAVALVFLIQFAYRFPVLMPSRRREALVALVVSGLYAFWEAGFAIYRFVILNNGIVEYRWKWSDYLLLLVLLWGPIAFLRQLYAVERREGHRMRFWDPLIRPQTHAALGLRNFALIFLFVAGLNVFNILRAVYLLTVSLANMGISLGVLVALFAFALTYVNAQPEITSFIVKIASVALTLMLAGLGVVGWVVSPSYIAHYQPQLPVGETLRFTPNARGGYEIAAVPFAFESGKGVDLRLEESYEGDKELGSYCSQPLSFAFPFYGKVYPQLFVCNDGTLGLDQPLPYRNYQYRLGGGAPVIMPLLTDLYPDISSGAVLAHQEPGRLIVTWEQQRAFRYPGNVFTFQAILYSDGVFEFSYLDVPSVFLYQPNDDPGANPWVIGALPEGFGGADADQVKLVDAPLSSGAAGIIEDFYLEFRQHLHAFMLPLARLIILASTLIVVGIPLQINTSLVQPLKALLYGVQQVQAGNYEVHTPVRFSDEIGFLTDAFNGMAGQLNTQFQELEGRVASRTAELDAANAQLRAEVSNREELITDLRAYSHTVAHDLKTPLTLITGYSDLIRESCGTETDAELIQFVNRISDASTKMIRMIEGILAFSSVRQAELHLRSLEMAGIVEEALNTCQPLIVQMGARVTFPSQWPVVVGHPQWVEEVWTNYISNALKYGVSPEAGLPPTVELGWDYGRDVAEETLAGTMVANSAFASAASAFVRFWVRDKGRGIPQELQMLLFRPFERLQKTGKDGHGLGLSIVKRMVTKLGGEVGVESAPGKGSCFWFTLRLADTVTPAVLAEGEEGGSHLNPALVQRLSQQDPVLRVQLARAAEVADLSDLQASVAQLMLADPSVGMAFSALLYDFDYETMLALLEAAKTLNPA